ncbi:MAG: fructoselysine 6-kinase [Bacillota bacterium]|nr:fructoselysine 6-kinase [Bacillota bacterium]
MERKIRIAAAGDNCVDAYSDGNAYPGGNPVNVAVYVKRLGGESAYIGAVGTDSYGRIMLDAIAGKGVDISRMKVLEGNTAVSHVEIINGDRVFGEYDEGVMAEFKLNAEDIAFLAEYDMVVSGLWGMCEQELPLLKEKGATIAFDFATKLDDPVVGIAIPYVDYGFFSIDDQGEEEIRAFLLEMHAKGPKVVVATRGEAGSIAYDGREFYTYGIVPVDVVDTMGAGDSFIAGFLYAVCEGKTVPEAMAAGAANSSVTLSYAGAW